MIDLDRHLDACGNSLWVREIRRSYCGTAQVKEFLDVIIGRDEELAKEAVTRFIGHLRHSSCSKTNLPLLFRVHGYRIPSKLRFYGYLAFQETIVHRFNVYYSQPKSIFTLSNDICRDIIKQSVQLDIMDISKEDAVRDPNKKYFHVLGLVSEKLERDDVIEIKAMMER